MKAVKKSAPFSPDESCKGRVNKRQNLPVTGRDCTLIKLASCVDMVRDGRGKVVLVSGSKGMGKSRILSEIKDFAMVRNVTALREDFTDLDSIFTFYSLSRLINRFFAFAFSSGERAFPLFPYSFLSKNKDILVENRFVIFCENFYKKI